MADVATTPRKDGKPRLGGNLQAAKARRLDFVRAYIANGRNASHAAIAVGISDEGRAASTWAARTMRRPDVRALIDKELTRASSITGLTLERTLRECARVAYSDPGQFYNPDGTLKPIVEWDSDMRGAVSELETKSKPKGVTVTKLKFWDKNAAIDKAMRHLGAYERDNAQRSENLAIQVVLVGGPEK